MVNPMKFVVSCVRCGGRLVGVFVLSVAVDTWVIAISIVFPLIFLAMAAVLAIFLIRYFFSFFT